MTMGSAFHTKLSTDISKNVKYRLIYQSCRYISRPQITFQKIFTSNTCCSFEFSCHHINKIKIMNKGISFFWKNFNKNFSQHCRGKFHFKIYLNIKHLLQSVIIFHHNITVTIVYTHKHILLFKRLESVILWNIHTYGVRVCAMVWWHHANYSLIILYYIILFKNELLDL